MSPFFDDLESQLRDAAQAHARARGRAGLLARLRRWPRAVVRGLPVAAAVAVAVAVAAVVLVGHGRGPGSGPQAGATAPTLGQIFATTPKRQLRRELAYMHAATRTVQASPACRLRGPAQPAVIDGTPSGALRAELAVLRRPATAADRLPEGWDMGGMAAAYRGQARRALTAGGVTSWIVPAREDPGAHQPTPRCLHLQQAAIRKYQPKIPQPLRRPTLDLATRLIAVDLAAVSQRPFDVVCTVYHFHSGGGANCGPTAAEIRSGQPSTESNGVFVGVVPDGVASVTLQVPAQGGRPAGSGTGAVHGNMFAIRVPRVGGEVGRGATAIWRSPTGAILRTVRQPNPGAVRRACRRDPARCLAVRTGPAQSSVASSSATSATPASPYK